MSKPLKHKNQNTFRFQSFSERIEKIGIKLGKHSTVPQDADTHFAQSLTHWLDLNITQHFVDLQRQVVDKVQSHPQLLHYKNEVCSALQHHLQIIDSLALQPVLDLLVQFARDLQDDFMPFFEQFFKLLVSLLNCRHHDIDALEWIFTCLAKLFWFLRRFLIKDLTSVYRLCSPLLSSRQYKDYINNFAAESFSYLMRKAKNREELFDLMFTELQSCSDRVNGVGRLLFEMIKMPHRQFFSCYQQVIPMLLSRLSKSSDVSVSEVLKTMWKLMAKHLTSATSVDNEITQHCSFVLKSLQTCVLTLHDDWSSQSGSGDTVCGSGHQLAAVLQLVNIWISHKAGSLVTEQAQLVETLVRLFVGRKLPTDSRRSLLDVISTLLMASNCEVETRHRVKLLTTVYKADYSCDEIFAFTRALFDISLFEKDVLPALIGYCQSSVDANVTCANEVLVMMTSLLLVKAPPAGGYTNPKIFQHRYPLDFRAAVKRVPSPKSFPEYLVEKLREHTSYDKESSDKLIELWMVVRLLPHVIPIDESSVTGLLEQMLNTLMSQKIVIKTHSNVDMLLRVVEEIVMSLGFIVGPTNLSKHVSLEFVTNLIELFPTSIPCLRLVDIVLTCFHEDNKNALLTRQVFDEIFQNLEPNLSSPFSLVRLLTLHVLCQFELPLPALPPDTVIEQRGLFVICLDAEVVSLNVLTDRERLRHLEKLNHDYIHHQLPSRITAQVPLRYLLGQLYVNFKPLWQPVRELIKSYATGMSLNDFWSVVGPFLNAASQHVTDSAALEAATPLVMSSESPEAGTLFAQHMELKDGSTDRPDYVNYRHELWIAMQQFPEICEPRSRIIVPLFFDFVEKEFMPSDLNLAATQDLRTPSVDDTLENCDEESTSNMTQDVEMEEHEEDMVEDGEEVDGAMVDAKAVENNDRMSVVKPQENTSRVSSKRASNDMLVLFLGLFAKFRDPTSLVRHNDLRCLYLELLKSPSTKVQSEAFKCLLTYKHKYLTPYRENFERLINDKSFRNELVLFSIDSENSPIDNEHRDQLLPVLMRILYGKMKAGKEVSSKLHGQLRKSTILAFVASSRQHEITMFFDLIFEPFLQSFNDDVKKSLQGEDINVQMLMKDVDVAKAIPLRKQQSLLNTVMLVLHKCGSLVGDYLPRLLHVIVYMTAYSSALLEHRTECLSKHVHSLKSLRHTGLTLIVEFFNLFENYPFSLAEIDAIFDAAVWPQLEKLPQEGVYSPTPILKLFHSWSKSQRYMVLLSKCKHTSTGVTPVSCTLALLSSPRCATSVVAIVMDIVDNLLMSDEMDMGNDAEPINPGTVIELPDDTDIPYGTLLLIPHIPVVLHFLQSVVKKLASANSKNKSVPAQELSILSRLSEYVTDGSQSCDIVSLLLPFLGRRLKRSEQIEVDILTSVQHLISRCGQPQQFVHSLAELFSVLSAKESRKTLCEIFTASAALEPELAIVAKISAKLNAWDARQVEEPDLATRMDGFNDAKQLVNTAPLNTALLLALVHNCTFLLASLEGLSGFALRDQSSECLECIIVRVSTHIDGDFSNELFRDVVVRHLLTQIKNNLKNKSETARHAFISVLDRLVQCFPTSVHFSDLVGLRDDADVEVDFFKNIVHVQLHRRMKALRRLSRFIASHSIRSETFTNYILPIVTSLLRDETFTKNSDRVDVAVETLGTICKYLAWPRYLIILRYYLTETLKAVENQKLFVKVLVTVLDNFPFDLRNSQFTTSTPYLAEPAGVEKTTQSEVAKDEPMFDEMVEGVEPMEDGNEMDSAADAEAKNDHELANICTASLATRIHRTIVTNILPQLHKCLTREAKTDGAHKLAVAGKYAEDEEILRVPVALALVKLLQRLPKDALDTNLPGVLMKVCRFLCSRAKDIRTASRDTLTKIVQSLGPSYFSFVVNEMRAALKRGYQLHVLCYSLWTILKNISPLLQSGDLDSSVVPLTEIFNEELFGQVADEKEVEGIVSKLFEAKTTKSIDSYAILATVVSKSTLAKLILPLKTELLKTRSSRVTKKVSDVLKLISRRLVDNKGLELDYLLTFVYSLTTESLDGFTTAHATTTSSESKTKQTLRPPSTLLLKATPSRCGTKAKQNVNTNLHILVEFGLQLLHLLLKRSAVNAASLSSLQLVDPFVATLTSCLSSKHIKVTSASLRCLLWMLRLPLPSLKRHVTSITSHLFVLLNNYAGAGAGKGDNFELVVMCFKVLTILVRHVTYHTVTEQQLHILLVFIKQDLNDFTRQATAFSLLKSIISRKLVDPELEKIVEEIEQMSIVADAASVRQQCRQIALQFMLDYPLSEKKLDNQHIEFYLHQLTYEHESGRTSAFEMLTTIFTTFPQIVLVRNANLFFSALVLRLINDESTNCRQMAAAAIKLLLNKLSPVDRDQMLDMCVQWVDNSTKISMLRMSAKAIGLFVEVESVNFKRHLMTVLPRIKTNIVLKTETVCESVETQRQHDLLLFDFLMLLLKIIRHTRDDNFSVVWSQQAWSDVLTDIWGDVEIYLTHPHDWVKFVSAQLFGELFSACSPDEIVSKHLEILSSGNKKCQKARHSDVINEKMTSLKCCDYLTQDMDLKLHSLGGAFCRQLTTQNITQQLADQVVCNLLHLCRLLALLPVNVNVNVDDKRTSIFWLIKRLVSEIKTETSGITKSNIKRKSVYQWLLGLAKILGSEKISRFLPAILRPLVREMTDGSTNSDEDLKSVCQQTLDTVKQIIGNDEFGRQYAVVQQTVTVRRLERKTQRSAEAVTNPELNARRKMNKNIKKKETKKRKIADFRPSKKSKKMKTVCDQLTETF